VRTTIMMHHDGGAHTACSGCRVSISERQRRPATAIDHIAVAHHGADRVLLPIYVDDLNPIVGPAGHKLETVRQALEDKSGRQVALHVVSTSQRYAPPPGWVQPLWGLN